MARLVTTPGRISLIHKRKSQTDSARFLLRARVMLRHASAARLAVLLLLGTAAPTLALDPTRPMSEYMIDFWQEDSGLPQKHVYAIYQTRDGYIWIGTRGGLARFDGVRFTVYDDREPDQLPDSEVYALSEGTDRSLWIGTYGAGLARLRDGVFTTRTTKEGLPSNFITVVAGAPDGSVWAGSNHGFAHVKTDGTVTRYTKKDGLPDENTKCFYFDGAVTWVGMDNGLASIKDGKVTNHLPEFPANDDDDKNSVAEIIGDGEGGLLLASGRGLLRRQNGAMTIVSKPGGSVRGLSRDPKGVVWFATSNTLLRMHEGRIDSYRPQVSGIGPNRTGRTFWLGGINTLFADREGSVWIGMTHYGVARVRDAVFTTLPPPGEDGKSAPIGAVFGDSHGAVWLTVGGVGVMRYNEGTLETVEHRGPGRPSLDTYFEDRDGTVWGVDDGSLYELQAGRPLKSPRDIEGVGNVVASLFDRKTGDIWLGQRSSGLCRYRDGQVTRYRRSDGVPGEEVRALAQDRRGNVWVGTKDGGLYALRDGALVAQYSTKDGLGEAVSAIHVDADDTLWVATRRGLARVREGRVYTYKARQGLPSNYFYQIIEDDLGHLWMTFGRGILRVSRQELNDVADGKAATFSSRAFGSESGMRSTTMIVPRQPVAHKAKDGRLWFATADGAVVVNPRSLVLNHVAPPVWIEDVIADRKSYPVGAAAVFPAGAADIEIRYTGLSFVGPQQVQFKYQLEGFDAGWVDAGTRRVAYYTQLPPGSYRFHVKACNNDGVWNETGHDFRFEIPPRWYQTVWFKTGLVFFAGLSLLALHRYRVRGHERREKELARRVDEAVSHVQTLRGLLPICANCKKIRDDKGYWNQMETYISQHSGADFSHGVCPDCLSQLYPEYAAATGGSNQAE